MFGDPGRTERILAELRKSRESAVRDQHTWRVPYPPAVEAWAKGRRTAELERKARRATHAELAEFVAGYVPIPEQALALAGELLDRFEVLQRDQRKGGE